MEFLVRIRIGSLAGLEDSEREALLAAEQRRGLELLESGHLVNIWRVPGRRENVSLYRTETVDELHELVSSLPLWPWMDVTVEPLAQHPLTARTGD